MLKRLSANGETIWQATYQVVQEISEDVLSASSFKRFLEFLLMFALFPLLGVYLNPDILTVDDSDDIWAAERAETIEVSGFVCESS